MSTPQQTRDTSDVSKKCFQVATIIKTHLGLEDRSSGIGLRCGTETELGLCETVLELLKTGKVTQEQVDGLDKRITEVSASIPSAYMTLFNTAVESLYNRAITGKKPAEVMASAKETITQQGNPEEWLSADMDPLEATGALKIQGGVFDDRSLYEKDK